jgi:hypothetical protein
LRTLARGNFHAFFLSVIPIILLAIFYWNFYGIPTFQTVKIPNYQSPNPFDSQYSLLDLKNPDRLTSKNSSRQLKVFVKIHF